MKILSSTSDHFERERRYPVLVTLDLVLHWLLCAGILGCALALLWVIVINNLPQLPRQIVAFWFKLWS
ncbi:MAG TPA: hypothetical protein VF627_07550 [Abditibacterium sp.]